MNGPQPDSYTVWERLEPVARNYDMTETLRAEVHDPLWAMTRQWQLGEFEGHDGGSPVEVTLDYCQDEISSVEISGESDGYDPMSDGPLEARVEREPVATGDPNYRLRLESGMHYLDRLGRLADDESLAQPRLASFDETYRLDMSEDLLDEEARRFEHVVGTTAPGDKDMRALDGYEIYDELDAYVVDTNGGSVNLSSASVSDLPVPDDWDSLPNEYGQVADAFLAWYRDLYDEPDGDGTGAWNEDRMEYDFAVETEGNGTTTRFEANEYTGGRLDWDDFTVDGGTDEGTPDTDTVSKVPTRLTFRGMPHPRYWAIEDEQVNFAEISAATEDVGWMTMIEIGLLAGTDWYMLPLSVEYGTLTRITDCTVMDTFDDSTTLEAETPVETTQRTDALVEKGWNTFLFDLPHRPEPGLFVPPVLGPAAESDPVERVRFTRDEMANLVFALENLVEGPLGDPLDRAEFDCPRVVVSDVVPAEDPDEEYVELENTGDDDVDITGWRIEVEVADSVSGTISFDGEQAVAGSTLLVHEFGSVEIPARGHLRLYTGGFETANTTDERHVGADESLWARGADLVSYQLHADREGETLVLEEPVGTVSAAQDPTYRLATDVPDHWFPLKADPTDVDDYLLRVALLLDADTLADTYEKIPKPLGEILTADAEIYEEEVTRQGLEVTRRYQLASDIDGRVHVWSGRHATVGGGEESSGLQFDILEDPDL